MLSVSQSVIHCRCSGWARETGHAFMPAGHTAATSPAATPGPDGHDAAIHAAAVYGADTDPGAFFTSAAHALVKGLRQAGVDRLVAVGLSALLPGPDGTRLLDAPGFPAEFRPFCLAHAAGLEVFRTEGGALDWVYVSPAGDFDHERERTGHYGVRAHGDAAARISYADFALVLLDEAETPRHHRSHLAAA
jgi:putative NADH-flavin reductase